MADYINTNLITNNLTSLNKFTTSSKYNLGLGSQTFSSFLNTSTLQSTALNANKAASQSSSSFTTCQNEPFMVTPVSEMITGDGFTIKEINPPKVRKVTPNNEPVIGAPNNMPPQSRGVVCGTSTGLANLNLSFNCNFVASVNLDSCLFKFQKVMKLYIKKLAKFAWSWLQIAFPMTLDYPLKLIRTICFIANLISKIICFIQQLIACILSTIKAILTIIEWVLSLPIKFVQMLIQCISNFFGNILGAMGSIVTALSSIFSGLFNCQLYQCPSITDINQITDISNISSDFTSGINNIWNSD